MKNIAVIGAVVLVFWAVVFFVLGRQTAESDQPSARCRNESTLLKLEISQHVIGTVRQQGADIVIAVDWRRWMTASRQRQINIGMAAYCGAVLQGKGGVVRIVAGSEELGRVAGGKWSSKYGE